LIIFVVSLAIGKFSKMLLVAFACWFQELVAAAGCTGSLQELKACFA
jgi:hypothetical protein